MNTKPLLPHSIVIATRESQLALWQAEHVQALLRARGHEVELLGMTTKGDQILDRTLSKVGGKGLFVKELEVALEEGRAHIAVHSLKDVPMELPEGFVLACVMEREDPRDAFVSNRYATLAELPQGAVVGTLGACIIAGMCFMIYRNPKRAKQLLLSFVTTEFKMLFATTSEVWDIVGAHPPL